MCRLLSDQSMHVTGQVFHEPHPVAGGRSREEGVTSSFARVDASADPRRFIDLLDAQRRRPFVREWKSRQFELLGARPGGRYLDAGCGTGADALELAAIAGETGRVTGVDASTAMVEEAQARAAAQGLGNVEFLVSDLGDIALPDDSFDGVRCERVLLYVPAPQRAIAELARVCAPGGTVVCSEPDSTTWMVDSPHPEVTRRIVDFTCSGIPNPLIGRQLRRLFVEAGLQNVTVEPRSNVITDYAEGVQLLEMVRTLERPLRAGAITAGEADTWSEALREAGRRGTFMWSMTYFAVTGRKPG